MSHHLIGKKRIIKMLNKTRLSPYRNFHESTQRQSEGAKKIKYILFKDAQRLEHILSQNKKNLRSIFPKMGESCGQIFQKHLETFVPAYNEGIVHIF
jgi:hypothetical protein